MESRIPSRQLGLTLAVYIPGMAVNVVALHLWNVRTPVSFSATGYRLLVGGEVFGAVPFVLYAVLNFAYVWVSVRLLLRGMLIAGLSLLMLFGLSRVPFFLHRPVPVW